MTLLMMYLAAVGLMLLIFGAIPAGGWDGKFPLTCPMSAGCGLALFLGMIAGSFI